MNNQELIDRHNQDTAICSVMHHMKTVSTTYDQIITKGNDIVPDILKYLRDNESAGMSVMMLLWDITKESPYEPESIKGTNGKDSGFVGFDVHATRKAWINWGKERNLIS